MKFLEVRGVFLSAEGTEAQVGVDCDVGVVAFIGEEGRDTSGCARGVVKRELRKWKEFGPVVGSYNRFGGIVREFGSSTRFDHLLLGDNQR